MDCIKSFNLSAEGGASSSTPGTSYLSWTDVILQNSGFVFSSPLGNAMEFFPSGFKGVDIYGLKIGVYVQTSDLSPTNAVIQDYGIKVNLTGVNVGLGGTFGTPMFSNYQLTTNNMLIFTKSTGEFEFPTPIKSVSKIDLTNIFLQGFTPQATSIAFDYYISLVGYYKFDGE